MKNIFLIFVSVLLILSCSGDDNSLNNLMESEDFLKNNLSNPGVFEIEAGLQYEKLKTGGSGISPSLEDVINADFHGTLLDGSVFWSSIENGEPLVVTLAQLIPGCQKAISLMEVGDSWKLFIHPDLAYGTAGRPGIPSNSLLIFEVSLHLIET
jgi:FKBP-type peptidyl-prolyl cis-trans isomerase